MPRLFFQQAQKMRSGDKTMTHPCGSIATQSHSQTLFHVQNVIKVGWGHGTRPLHTYTPSLVPMAFSFSSRPSSPALPPPCLPLLMKNVPVKVPIAICEERSERFNKLTHSYYVDPFLPLHDTHIVLARCTQGILI